jgi:hypothetical protein
VIVAFVKRVVASVDLKRPRTISNVSALTDLILGGVILVSHFIINFFPVLKFFLFLESDG